MCFSTLEAYSAGDFGGGDSRSAIFLILPKRNKRSQMQASEHANGNHVCLGQQKWTWMQRYWSINSLGLYKSKSDKEITTKTKTKGQAKVKYANPSQTKPNVNSTQKHPKAMKNEPCVEVPNTYMSRDSRLPFQFPVANFHLPSPLPMPMPMPMPMPIRQSLPPRCVVAPKFGNLKLV